MGSDSCAHASSVSVVQAVQTDGTVAAARGEALNLRRFVTPRLGHRRRARHEREVPKQKALDIPRALDEGHGSWKVRRAELVVAIGGD